MKIRFALICVTFLHLLLIADARTGELFGYKIGNRYPVTKTTKRKLNWPDMHCNRITTENAQKPKKIDKVEVCTTVKTETILSIDSINEFKSQNEALEFFNYFSEILKARYTFYEWDSLDEIYPDFPISTGGMNILIHELNKNYELLVMVAPPPLHDKVWAVTISLIPIGEFSNVLQKQKEKEHGELLLERAEKDKNLKGL